MSALTVLPKRTSLYELEESLQALLDTEAAVPPEQQEEFARDLQETLKTTIEKRDRVGWFLAHLESQMDLAAKEIRRLQSRKATCENVYERMESYVLRAIESLGKDEKGKFRKLEGNTVTLSAQKNPDSVAVIDEQAVPTEFKVCTVSLPAPVWESLLDALDMETRASVLDQVKRPDMTVSKSLVKKAIVEEKREVSGAKLLQDQYRLVVK